MTRSTLLLGLLLATPAFAQPAPPPAPGESGVTLDRYLQREMGRIMAFDTDGDGRISRAEMAAAPTRGGRDPSRRFDRMDTNHDGYLDQAEIRTALTQRFQRMDRNGDGVLTPDERMAGRMGRRGRPAPEAPMPSPQQP
jgi:hypothetical protein